MIFNEINFFDPIAEKVFGFNARCKRIFIFICRNRMINPDKTYPFRPFRNAARQKKASCCGLKRSITMNFILVMKILKKK